MKKTITPEHRAKIAQSMKQYHSVNPMSDKTRAMMSEARKRYWTPERRELMSRKLKADIYAYMEEQHTTRQQRGHRHRGGKRTRIGYNARG